MKLQDLFEKKIQTDHAYLKHDWKTDLVEEEDEDYLPPGYDYKKVIEIEIVRVKNLSNQGAGKGYGKEVFDKFMQTADAKKAELIFLDLGPGEGKDLGLDDNQVMDKLEKIYKSWGFKNKHNQARMWIVQKGKIEDKDLPS